MHTTVCQAALFLALYNVIPISTPIMNQYLQIGHFPQPHYPNQSEILSFTNSHSAVILVCIVYSKYLYCYPFFFFKFRRHWEDDFFWHISFFLTCQRKFGLMAYALNTFDCSKMIHPDPVPLP